MRGNLKNVIPVNAWEAFWWNLTTWTNYTLCYYSSCCSFRASRRDKSAACSSDRINTVYIPLRTFCFTKRKQLVDVLVVHFVWQGRLRAHGKYSATTWGQGWLRWWVVNHLAALWQGKNILDASAYIKMSSFSAGGSLSPGCVVLSPRKSTNIRYMGFLRTERRKEPEK